MKIYERLREKARIPEDTPLPGNVEELIEELRYSSPGVRYPVKFPGDEQSIEKGLSKMKKGILVVSFGTSHLDTMEKTIDVIERDVSRKFPNAEYTGRLQAV